MIHKYKAGEWIYMSIKVNNLSYDKSIISDEEELNTSFKNEGEYPMNNIQVDKAVYSIYELKRKFDRKDQKIVLDSDFQRNSVWDITQKSELIESVLMGLPLPLFYFFEDRLGRLIVIDGRQRITTFFEFMDDKFALKKLMILPEFSGSKFSELEYLAQVKIEDYQIQTNVIKPPTPDQIKFDIFDRVNRGGTQLNKQEIRNALYQGNSTQLLKDICSTDVFSNVTDNAFHNNTRMKDRYLILRFIAFELYFECKLFDDDGELYEYKNDIDDLLGRTMEYLNNLDDNEIEDIKKFTFYSLENSYFYFGKHGFRLSQGQKQSNRRSPINMNLFECLMHLMRNIPLGKHSIKSDIQLRVNHLLINDVFLESIRKHRDNLNNIVTRYNMVNNIIKELNIK